MKIFHCDHCDHLLFFENTNCVNCGRVVAYIPELGGIASLDPAPNDLWTSPLPEARGKTFRLCQNYVRHNVCNWAYNSEDRHQYCLCGRLTRTIPDLSVPGHHEQWAKLEAAKRRLVYTLLQLGLPVKPKVEDPQNGLEFNFLSDDAPGSPLVLTGHENGTITLNLAEADDVERERRRIQLHEPYRTLLGHFRHEVGHYYWDRLVKDSPNLEAFRKLFGDDSTDYALALQRHYHVGPPPDWQLQFVSAYATMHPWEDWAETWAHYMHIVDTLETAAACGINVRPRRKDEPSISYVPNPATTRQVPFDKMMEAWTPLTYVMNNLNRGLGIPDAYPFVLSPLAIEKLRFVHDVIDEANGFPPEKQRPLNPV